MSVPSSAVEDARSGTTADVVICCYTEQRWELLVRSVESVLGQTRLPRRLVICVDHNEALLERCRDQWAPAGVATMGEVEIVVLPNAFAGRLGSARNTAVLQCSADVIAFLDDDAEADASWLTTLVDTYDRTGAAAVGGAPQPNYGGPRPAWFPTSFNWVFGCHYDGLPESLAPTRHLIGASMTVRRDAILSVGGFHADNHDDMDLSHRIAHAYGADRVLYQPAAEVQHFVDPSRLTWRYFWQRCFYVNRGKVVAFADMGEAGNMGAEVSFGLRTLAGLLLAPLYLLTGRRARAQQSAVAVAGVVIAGAGYVAGRIMLATGRHQHDLTVGLPDTAPSVADRAAS